MEFVITNNQPTTKGGGVVVRTTAFRADAALVHSSPKRHPTYFMSSEEREAYWAEHRDREEDEAWRLVTIPEPTPSDIREELERQAKEDRRRREAAAMFGNPANWLKIPPKDRITGRQASEPQVVTFRRGQKPVRTGGRERLYGIQAIPA